MSLLLNSYCLPFCLGFALPRGGESIPNCESPVQPGSFLALKYRFNEWHKMSLHLLGIERGTEIPGTLLLRPVRHHSFEHCAYSTADGIRRDFPRAARTFTFLACLCPRARALTDTPLVETGGAHTSRRITCRGPSPRERLMVHEASRDPANIRGTGSEQTYVGGVAERFRSRLPSIRASPRVRDRGDPPRTWLALAAAIP